MPVIARGKPIDEHLVDDLLLAVAKVWLTFHEPPEEYTTTGNRFLHAAEAAYFKALRDDGQ